MPMEGQHGTFYQTLDAKGRMSFPTKLREYVGDKFVITKGVGKCLAVYSLDSFDELTGKLKKLPLGKGLGVQRYFLASATEVEPDKQGRILVPQPLREFASLEKELVVAGVVDHAEIWDKSEWEAYNEEQNTAEAITATLEGLDL